MVDTVLKWLTVRDASNLLGISPKTLRRWADAGLIPVATTAGGHRRFLRDDVEKFRRRGLDRDAWTAAVARLVDDAERRDREVVGTFAPATPPALADEARTALRERGEQVLGTLLRHLERSGRLTAHALNAACRLSRDYGRQLALLGLPLPVVVASMTRFETEFLEEVARMLRTRRPTRHDPLSVLLEAQRASGSALRALLEGYAEIADAGAPGGSPPGTDAPTSPTSI